MTLPYGAIIPSEVQSHAGVKQKIMRQKESGVSMYLFLPDYFLLYTV